MLTARFAPRWQAPPRRTAPTERNAIIIGAGLAGSAACERLAARGWRLTLIERHAQPAHEASGNLAGIVMPLLSKDDNPTSRLTRAAYLFTLHLWRRVGGIGIAFSGEACGVLQLARDAADAQTQRAIAALWKYPAGFARWLDAAAAASLLGGEQSNGGWLFAQGGWVHPESVCRALLAACGEQVDRRFAQAAASLEWTGNQWRVRDAGGVTIAQAPVVILANGTNATVFPQTDRLPLTAIRGQVTHLPAASLPSLPVVVCGEGYVTRPFEGICCIGASYDSDADPQLRRDSHDGNLARLAAILPRAAAGVSDSALAGHAVAGRVAFRCVTPDRLPMVGALPDQAARIGGDRLREMPRLPGLYGLFGYASRGLIWAPFAAELLASQLEGEPLPVEHELAAALDPARFALKAYRRG
jgi:tRNA 5-methylaminomethyl-2-thiouridine biosynthesis bifunctional protein